MNKIKQSTLFKAVICIIICVAIAIFSVYFYVETNLKPSSLSGVYSEGIEPDDDNLYFSFQMINNNSSKKITVLSANGISYDIKFVGHTPLI